MNIAKNSDFLNSGRKACLNRKPDLNSELNLNLSSIRILRLLSDKLIANTVEGYTTFIISESESQIERLNDIFTEINPEAHFTPLLLNLHNGFTDNDLKISIYTDHQIFDRYHKFRIRGYFTKKRVFQ